VYSTGHGTKTDHTDAVAIARAAIHSKHLRHVQPDGPNVALKLLSDRRSVLVRSRTSTVCRLHMRSVSGNAASVADALRHGDDGDVVAGHLGGHEVAQIVEAEAADAGTTEVTDELLGHSVRQPRPRPVAVGGEHEGVVGDLDPVRRGTRFGPAPVFDHRSMVVSSIATR
jgi:hypothetical protein